MGLRPSNFQFRANLSQTMLTKTALKQDLNQSIAKLRSAEITSRDVLIAQAKRKTAEISELRDQVQGLRKLVDTPRIQSPKAGTILRIKHPKNRSVIGHAIDFIHLGDTSLNNFSLVVDVPDSAAKHIADDQSITFAINGHAKQDQVFLANLKAVGGTATKPVGGYRRYQVVPTSEAQAALAKLDRRLALTDPETQAEIRIHFAPRSIPDFVKGTLKRLWISS